jgi:hypothetical protein
MIEQLTLPLLTVVFSAGAAYGGVKAGLNGTKAAVARIESKVDSLSEDNQEIRERVVRVETTLNVRP